MTQVVLHVADLPDSPLAASEAFFASFLAEARATLAKADALVLVMPAASSDHDDWRRSVARDLAREYAPKRVNVIGADPGEARDATLAYLAAAPGVTGQYIAADE